MYKLQSRLSIVIVVALLLGIIGLTIAQGGEVIEALNLSDQPLVLEFSTGIAGPPSFEALSDGRAVLRINAEGTSTGAIEGTMTATITEVMPGPDPVLQGMSIMFTITTEQGSLQGYYIGSIYHPEGAEFADTHASGQILTVSGAYADLYLASVYVSGQVQFVDGRGVSDSGTMTIVAQ